MKITEKREKACFIPGVVQQGDFIQATGPGWDTPIKGLVTTVWPYGIRVLFLPRTPNTSQVLNIYADAVESGDWEIIISRDLRGEPVEVEGEDPSEED